MNVYEMTIPVSVAYYIPSNYADMTVDPKVRIDQIGGLLDSGVEHVDITGPWPHTRTRRSISVRTTTGRRSARALQGERVRGAGRRAVPRAFDL